MSQRDCGCGGLVTPTLDELLAVARNKPLPRVRVRERRAPPARVGATMKGWLSWRLIDRRGREVRAGEGPNLILDQGLDMIASVLLRHTGGNLTAAGHFPIIGYCAVGTDSTAPDPSQVALGSELARTNNTFATDAISRPASGVYQLVKSIEFDYNEANGNLTEWGFSNSSSAGSNLFNRALFTDDEGDPDVVTKTEEEKLRITYTLEVALSPVSLTPGSFDIAGVGTINGDYMLVGGSAPSSISNYRQAPDLHLFSGLARGVVGTVSGISQWPALASARVSGSDLSGTTYSTALVNEGDAASNTVARDVEEVRDSYTPGSFERMGGAWRWDTAVGNLDPIRGIVLGGNSVISEVPAGYVAYVFDFDTADEFSKDDEHALIVGVPTVSWGRASS